MFHGDVCFFLGRDLLKLFGDPGKIIETYLGFEASQTLSRDSS